MLLGFFGGDAKIPPTGAFCSRSHWRGAVRRSVVAFGLRRQPRDGEDSEGTPEGCGG